jgi:hypothetical protein
MGSSISAGGQSPPLVVWGESNYIAHPWRWNVKEYLVPKEYHAPCTLKQVFNSSKSAKDVRSRPRWPVARSKSQPVLLRISLIETIAYTFLRSPSRNMCHRRQRTCFVYRSRNSVLLSPFMTCHCISIKSNMTCATSGAGTAYYSGTP